MLNAGEMRNKITFETEQTITNANGFKETAYIKYKTVYAKVNNLFGREFWAAEAVQKESTIVFDIRYNKDIENLDIKKTRINFRGRHLSIIHIDNVLYKNETLKIKAIEVA